MNVDEFIPVAIMVVVGVALLSRALGRATSLQRLAERRGFAFDGEMPLDFPTNILLPTSRLYRWGTPDQIGNVVYGWEGPDLLLAFDIEFLGSRWGTGVRTVVARRSSSFRGKFAPRRGLRYFASGDWRILIRRQFPSGSRLHPEAIEQGWELLKGSVCSEP
jgi:hypothetical protein